MLKHYKDIRYIPVIPQNAGSSKTRGGAI